MSDVAAEETTGQLDTAAQLEMRRSWRALMGSFGTLAVGEGVARIFGLVAVVVMARQLGPGGFGVITFGLTIIGWFALVQDSGTEILSLREISRNPRDFTPIASRVLGLRLTLSILAMVAYVALVAALAKFPLHRETLLGFTLMLPVLAFNLRWMVLGIKGARIVAFGNVVGRIVLMIGVLLFVTSQGDLSRVPFLLAAAELAFALVVLVAVTRRFSFPRPTVDVPAWRATLRQSYPLMASSFSRGIVAWFDVFLIGILLEPRDVGLYGAALKPVFFGIGLIGFFSLALLSTYSGADRTVALQLTRRATRLALGTTVPVAVVLTVSAGTVLPLIFGRSFEAGATALAILAWRIPATGVSVPFVTALIAHDAQRTIMRNYIVAAIIALVGSSIAVPLMGIEGASIVGVLTAVVACALNYRGARSRDLVPPLSKLIGRAPEPRAGVGQA